MKEIYLVYAEASPTKGVTNADDIAGADAIIFVAAQSKEEAPILARSALINYGYHLTEVLSVSVPSLSAVSRLDPQLKVQYKAAIDRGYGFELIAQSRDPNHPVEIRSLGSPIFDETKKH